MHYKILITGANRGLGLAITEQLLALEHQVFAMSRHESQALSGLRDRFQNTLHCYLGDLTVEQSIQDALGAIGLQTDDLDIIINNAAVHLEHAAPRIEEADFSEYLHTFQVNSISPLMVIKHALPLLRAGNKKLIANISSEAGSISDAWRKAEYSYCMSKAALNMGIKLLQNALECEGIKVLAIHPGWFSSDMGGAQAPITPSEAAQDIVSLIVRPIDLKSPTFINSKGEEMRW